MRRRPVLVGGPALFAGAALVRGSRAAALGAGVLVVLLALTSLWFAGVVLLPAGVLLLVGAAVRRA